MDKFFNSVRSYPLRRTHDGMLGGVCAGIGHRWGISPLLIRILFVLGLVFGGISFFIYGLLWLLVPTYPDNQISLEQTIRGNPQGSTLAAGLMTLIGLVGVSSLGHFIKAVTVAAIVLFIPFIVLGFLVWAIIASSRKKRNNNSQGFAQAPYSATPYTAAPNVQTTHEHASYNADMPGTGAPSADTPWPASNESAEANNKKSYFASLRSPNAQAYEQAPPAPVKAKTPAASGMFIACSLAVALATTAVVLLAGGGTMGGAIAAVGAGFTILGIGILIAGARGLRATWLTVLAWLVSPIVLTALLVGIATPSSVLKDPHYRNFTVVSSLADSNTTSVMNNSTITISKDTKERTAEISTVISNMKFIISNNEPIVFHVDGLGELIIQNSQGWQVLDDDNAVIRMNDIRALKDAKKAGKDSAKQATQQDRIRFELSGPVTVANAAAVKEPEKARHIHLDFTVGKVEIRDLDNIDPALGSAPDAAPGSTPALPEGAPAAPMQHGERTHDGESIKPGEPMGSNQPTAPNAPQGTNEGVNK
ncbi:phage shock protein PspC (stress-responsive transcriptional regulator) [Arcanobacterium pluranimalium]|uniref:PspC domain-containing protein n=1 Tax=Arcanobacterium pluranimalium TaxID=108028 RepID=UPI00195C2AAF|nr:PspC domain-containing protein [Arcanobacterium pluranimalium]MBM7825056.1 phage shock protein PspC (stress-responsive transcriptional regulator) [Arcanobacterium pluranimalium]